MGKFTIDRAYCNSEVFSLGLSTGWSSNHEAIVTSDIAQVSYRLWCYSCLKNLNASICSNGVVQ